MAAACGKVVSVREVRRFIVEAMCSVGSPRAAAEQLSELLAAADCRGHFSHGLNRLQFYVEDVRSGACVPHAQPTIIRESVSTALVDGANSLGVTVGNYCVDIAINKARSSGMGWVVAGNSNHYGIAGWYTLRCANAGLMGLSFTNSSPLVAAVGGCDALLGSNPISCAVPSDRDDTAQAEVFCLDMATCTAALGKVEIQRRRRQNIPAGWAIDRNGHVTRDPDQVNALLPLGGEQLTGGHKGYGLAFLVELFCGIAADAAYGPLVRRWTEHKQAARLGQCFVAVDVHSCFAEGFGARLRHLMRLCRESRPSDPNEPIMVAGDPEMKHQQRVVDAGGIGYHDTQLQHAHELASQLNIKPLDTICSRLR